MVNNISKILFYFVLLFFISMSSLTLISKNDKIIDSQMTFEEAIKGTKAPKELIDSLCLIDVDYYSIDNKLHTGQLVINKSVKNDIVSIFKLILKERFKINKVIPIVNYKWDDSSSMEDNNTSAFCYRNIAGKNKLSNHSFGRAIDINPFFNPVIYKDGSKSPSKATYNKNYPGTFSEVNIIVKEFKKLGWRWGGNFNQYKDNHHFDKEN